MEMKSSINQIQSSIESITSQLHQVEKRILMVKDKAEELLHSDSKKEKF
jgi:prefoldin subunit 5